MVETQNFLWKSKGQTLLWLQNKLSNSTIPKLIVFTYKEWTINSDELLNYIQLIKIFHVFSPVISIKMHKKVHLLINCQSLRKLSLLLMQVSLHLNAISSLELIDIRNSIKKLLT